MNMTHNNRETQCGCVFTPVMAYVPFQEFGAIYPPEQALRRGTVFESLYKPWKVGGKVC